MKKYVQIAVILSASSLCFAQSQGQVVGQQLNAEAKSKEVAEARAKRNAQTFQNNATVLTFLDRYGKRTGQIGKRAIYFTAILSPDGKRVATLKEDLDNESADLWVLDVATGTATRLTTSVRTEFVLSPVWSPDSKRLAYVTIRKGQEGIYASRERAGSRGAPVQESRRFPESYRLVLGWSIPDLRHFGH